MKYLNNELQESQYIDVENGSGIGYVLPKKVYLNDELTVKINFRVTKPYNDVKLIIKQGDKVIKEQKKAYLIPAEMESVVILKKDLKDNANITIEVVQ